MRTVLIPFVLIAATGCGMFGGGTDALVSAQTDCVSNYEGWADAIKDGEDEDEFFAVFDEIVENDIAETKATAAAHIDVSIEVYEMEEGDREDFIEEYADLLEDPTKDCNEAVESFQEELADNEDACEAYFDWQEEQEESWEDFEKAVQEYREDAKEDAVRIPSYQGGVHSPKDKYEKDMCSDKKDKKDKDDDD